MKLTKGAVAALTSDKPDQVFWDDELPGFGVRLRDGKKSWLLQYRANGKSRREKLGDIRQVAIEAARSIARQRFAAIELGRDPSAERTEAKAAAAAPVLTFGAVADRYLADKDGTVRPKTLHELRRHLTVQWAPLRERPIADVKLPDVAFQLGEIKKASRSTARAARANLSGMFNWAIGEALVENNPVNGTNDPAEGIEPRDRVLSDAELGATWTAAGDAGDFGKIVKLLILTGTRRDEIGSLRWTDIDFDAAELTIRAEVAKNGVALVLPLADLALDILNSVERRSDHVFGRRLAGSGFQGYGKAMSAFRARLAFAEHWTLHDLRRTARTNWSKLGIAPHVSERLLNHVENRLKATYDRYAYRDEKRAALVLWAERFAGRKVIPLRTRA